MKDEQSFAEELRALLASGRKIEAIQLYRERNRVRLAEAKQAVEALERAVEQGESSAGTGASEAGVDSEIIALLRRGEKIEAVKLYRERSGVELKEAKQAVEALAAEHRIVAPNTGCLGVLVLLAGVLLAGLAAAADSPAKISEARPDEDGCLVHQVDSPFQSGQVEVRVLLPERLEPAALYPVVYVLPVEAGRDCRYGDGLSEIHQHALQNLHQAVFVGPTFSHLPWYADHPSDAQLRQETHFLKVVLPLVEERYPVLREPRGRLLLGFSKSGWGAFSLLLRHPHVFGKAAAWDAPLMKEQPDQFGMKGIFGTQENFLEYQITGLLQQRAGELHSGQRIVLTGYGNFRPQHEDAHILMNKLGISHVYRDGPPRKHDWHSGWVTPAVELLLRQ